ncbi:YoaK family protein [Pedobacter suwonensis]|uniref:YoaK family protein n=1 Tax=Pedobacter suwonensis TaxID=332999 RepID=UPI0036B1F1D9
MLRHLGAKRTLQHNLKLATLLGLTAGFVNAEGFLGFAVLTTNVTGHAALLAEKIALADWHTARVVALWMFLFLAGAFVSSLILALTGHNQRYSYSIAIFIEIIILLFCALCGQKYDGSLASKEIFAGSLLFAMGLQNSLVSMISGSVVRTTHLTGTFTDLGIELAQLFNKKKPDQQALKAKIKLRFVIIFFFMAGAVAGAILFEHFGFNAFYAPIGILIYALLYDIFRIKAKRYYRKRVNAGKRQ